MNISHFFELLLCLIVIALTRHFEGHMKISAATLYKELSWKSLSAQHQQWHRHCKNFIFLLQIFLGKNRTSISDAPQYYFFCLFFLYQYHFDTITHVSTISNPSIQRRLLVFKTNGCSNSRKHPSISVSEKVATRNILGNFPVKYPYWRPLSTLGSFSKSCSEQLFYREPVRTCFCKNEFQSTRCLRNLPEF